MKPTPPRIAEHPPKTAISLSDLKKLDRACDEFFRRRGTYVEYPQANAHRLRREAKEKAMEAEQP